MEKTKRVLALIGVVLLAGLYILTLVSAFLTTPATGGLFMASIFSTVAVPVLLYAYMLVYRILKRHNEEMNRNLEETKEQKEDTVGEDRES